MKETPIVCCTDPRLLRRDFLRVGSLSFLGISLSQFLRLKSILAAQGVHEASRKATAQACILLWLDGGASQVDTWDPKSNSSFRPISTNVPGVQISELLPRVARHMEKLSIIRSMSTEENNHPQATHYMITGHRPNPAMQFPSLGSIISKEMGARNNLPPYVLEPEFKTNKTIEAYFKAAFVGPEYDPMILPDASRTDFQLPDLTLPQSVSLERLNDRRSFLKVIDQSYRRTMDSAEYSKMDSFCDQAVKMILTPSVREAFDLSKESEKTKEAYGRNRVGMSVLLARRLVEAGSRFVTASGYEMGAWDAHSDNDKKHRDQLVPSLDRTLSVLLEDLKQRGLLDSTVVVVMGEFGRTPHVNPNKGRDHWNQCWSLVLGGGGINGGHIIGASDERGAYVADRLVTMGDVFATIYKAFGIDWEKTYMTPIGRPIKIANSLEDKTGSPIRELV